MAKNGQAKVLSNDELSAVLNEIKHHRYPAKNALIIQISFKLGLRAQEMALLRIREIAALSDEFARGYKIKDVLVLPKSFTKGARAMAAIGNRTNERTSVRFTVAEFDRLVSKISKDARRKKKLDATDYYPAMKKSGGQTRELPLADSALLEAISRYLDERMAVKKPLKPNAPLLLSQKGGFYSPNTLQDHMATMLREWSGIDRASSHSGRRTLATNLLHDQGEHLKTVQKVLGHKSAATTTIYQDVTEQEVRQVLKNAGKNYDI